MPAAGRSTTPARARLPAIGWARGRLGSVSTGEVAPEHLRWILAGIAPDGQVLTAGRVDPARRVTGFDLTFSAPKSVSLLYGLDRAR